MVFFVISSELAIQAKAMSSPENAATQNEASLNFRDLSPHRSDGLRRNSNICTKSARRPHIVQTGKPRHGPARP